MSVKTYLIILRAGIYLGFLSVFLVFNNLLFPYISSKQIYFNILIEILLVFWLALIIKYPEWRPKKSWISIGLIAFFAALFLSSIFGVDINLSFWGDIERMLGVFPLLHFLVFYFIIITVFRSAKDWRNLLLASVIAGVLISLHGIGQKIGWVKSPMGADRIISTIGNAAYVGAYTIFNIYFALILYFNEKNKNIKWLYLASAFIIMLALIFSGTRGAYLGFGASILILLILFSIFNKNKKVRYAVLSSFVILVAAIAVLFLNANTKFVSQNFLLNRLTYISLADATMQTRFISWKAALKDFPSHPIFGTGNGNYAITFDKYFTPKFYDFTASETYFDRAHNNLIDIASTSGLLGIASYLLIFAAVIYYLIKGFRSGQINLTDFLLLICLIVAYFIQNLVVFDALVTYLCLMVMLGYVHYLSKQTQPEEINSQLFINKEIFTLAIAGVIMLTIVYQFNIKVYFMLDRTIAGQMAFSAGDIIGGVEAYKQGLGYKTVLDRDSRATLINYIANNTGALTQMQDSQKAKEIVDYTIEQAEANVKYNPNDSMTQMQLAMVLNVAANLPANKASFYFYSDRALEAIDKSIAASPGRLSIYPTKAQILIMRGEKDKAIATMEYAASKNPIYTPIICNLAKIYIYFKNEDLGFKNMDQCLDLGDNSTLIPLDYAKAIAAHYLEKKDYKKLRVIYESIIKMDSTNANNFVILAKIYAELGDRAKAIQMANQAAQIDPAMKDGAESFIRGLGL